MPAAVLILATRYDKDTYYTYAWAQSLHSELIKYGHVCLMLDAERIRSADIVLTDAISRVDYVVFFGHGDAHQWIAMPSKPRTALAPIALIDTNTVSILDRKHVYAGCCHSLSQLGMVFSGKYKGSFVGYSQQFRFEVANHVYFRDIVNSSVDAFVSGVTAATVEANLKIEWAALRHDFFNGRLSRRPNAFAAALCADDNARNIGSFP